MCYCNLILSVCARVFVLEPVALYPVFVTFPGVFKRYLNTDYRHEMFRSGRTHPGCLKGKLIKNGWGRETNIEKDVQRVDEGQSYICLHLPFKQSPYYGGQKPWLKWPPWPSWNTRWEKEGVDWCLFDSILVNTWDQSPVFWGVFCACWKTGHLSYATIRVFPINVTKWVTI